MRQGGGALVLIGLDGEADAPLHRQIYDELRRQILDGRLRRGARLPSTRSLASDLRVSRSTVVQAFEQLRAEGYIDSVSRGSTRVSPQLPDALTHAEAPSVAARSPAVRSIGSPRGRSVTRAIARAWPHFAVTFDKPARAFRTSVPALDVFPVDVWGRLTARRWRRSPAASLAYTDSRGACGRACSSASAASARRSCARASAACAASSSRSRNRRSVPRGCSVRLQADLPGSPAKAGHSVRHERRAL
jgi:DNA-binding transcriptional regulator YhcF (GntR family)